MTYILVENVKNLRVLCKLFLISKCSAWSANRALDQFSPLPFRGLGNLRISFADLGNHLIPGDDSSVEVCRRRRGREGHLLLLWKSDSPELKCRLGGRRQS